MSKGITYERQYYWCTGCSNVELAEEFLALKYRKLKFLRGGLSKIQGNFSC